MCIYNMYMLTYAHVCSRMLAYADVCYMHRRASRGRGRVCAYIVCICSRMLTYAHVCWRMLYASTSVPRARPGMCIHNIYIWIYIIYPYMDRYIIDR
jgi:hypothetical protein